MPGNTLLEDYLSNLLADLDGKIKQCHADLKEPPRDPSKLKRLLKFIEKRNRLLRLMQNFRGRPGLRGRA